MIRLVVRDRPGPARSFESRAWRWAAGIATVLAAAEIVEILGIL